MTLLYAEINISSSIEKGPFLPSFNTVVINVVTMPSRTETDRLS